MVPLFKINVTLLVVFAVMSMNWLFDMLFEIAALGDCVNCI